MPIHRIGDGTPKGGGTHVPARPASWTAAGAPYVAFVVADLAASRMFYHRLLAMVVVEEGARQVSLRSEDSSMRLHLTQRGAGAGALQFLEGAEGGGHVLLHIDAESLPTWERRFALNGIVINALLCRATDQRSLYLQDPDGNPVEIVIRPAYGPPPSVGSPRRTLLKRYNN